MKIFSSSPYATFDRKEWKSMSRGNHRFSDTPIKIKKSYFRAIKYRKSSKMVEENNDLPKLMQLAFM